jgi:hypothetical protein
VAVCYQTGEGCRGDGHSELQQMQSDLLDQTVHDFDLIPVGGE